MKGFCAVRGFTMIELLVTISIISIMAALAIPSFNKMLTSNRAQVQSGLLFRSLNYARSEAVRRSTTVKVRPLSGVAWTQGWRVWIDDDGDDTFDGGEEELQHQDSLPGGSSITASSSVISFLASGYRGGSTNFATSDVTFLYEMGAGNSYCTKVGHGGRTSYEKKSTCP